METYNWSTVTEEKMNPLFSRQVIHTAQMTVARVWLGKGGVVPMHHHVNQQVTMLKSGSLLYETETGERLVLKPGDVLVIPPDLPHRFEALEDSAATDLFTPRARTGSAATMPTSGNSDRQFSSSSSEYFE